MLLSTGLIDMKFTVNGNKN